MGFFRIIMLAIIALCSISASSLIAEAQGLQDMPEREFAFKKECLSDSVQSLWLPSASDTAVRKVTQAKRRLKKSYISCFCGENPVCEILVRSAESFYESLFVNAEIPVLKNKVDPHKSLKSRVFCGISPNLII